MNIPSSCSGDSSSMMKLNFNKEITNCQTCSLHSNGNHFLQLFFFFFFWYRNVEFLYFPPGVPLLEEKTLKI